jgi:hypothetical protein
LMTWWVAPPVTTGAPLIQLPATLVDTELAVMAST